MDSPPFQAPPAVREQVPARVSSRQDGRGYDLTPEAIARRMTTWERQGRRCDANGRQCFHNAATRLLRVVDLDEAGEPEGEEYTIKCCSRHQKVWTRNPRRQVIDNQPLRQTAN